MNGRIACKQELDIIGHYATSFATGSKIFFATTFSKMGKFASKIEAVYRFDCCLSYFSQSFFFTVSSFCLAVLWRAAFSAAASSSGEA